MVKVDNVTIGILTVTDDVKLTVLVELDQIDIILINTLVILRNSKTIDEADLITLANEIGNLSLADGNGQSIGLGKIKFTDNIINGVCLCMNIIEDGITDIMLSLDNLHERMTVTFILPVALDRNGRKFGMRNLYMTVHLCKGLTDNIHQIASRLTKLWLYTFIFL